MNPGIVEETGATARKAVGALSSTPALLALILLQLVTVGAVTYGVYYRQQTNTEVVRALINQCGPRK